MSNLKNRLSLVKAQSTTFLSTLALFLMSGETAFADNPFTKTQNAAQELTSNLQGISLALFTVAAIVVAIVYGVGSEKLKSKMKEHAVAIAVAVIGVAAAPAALAWLYQFAQ